MEAFVTFKIDFCITPDVLGVDPNISEKEFRTLASNYSTALAQDINDAFGVDVEEIDFEVI